MASEHLPPRAVYPTDDEIAERAYQMLLDRLSAPMGITEYWKLAETELLERAATRAIRPVAASRPRRRRSD
jgi:hypothetical protein